MTDLYSYDAECSPSILAISKKAAANLHFMLENTVSGSPKSAKSFNDAAFISKIETFFSISPEKVFLVSYPSGEIVYANPAAIKKVKNAGLDISKRKISDFFTLYGPKGFLPSEDETKLKVFLLNNSVYEQIELTATDVSGGDFSLLLVYAKNITAIEKSKRILYESEIQHRSTINALRDGVVVINKDMEIVLYNKSFGSIVFPEDSNDGISDDMTGKKLGDVAPFLPGRLGLEYRYVFTSGESLDTTIKYRHDGKLKYYEIIKTPIFDEGKVIQVVTILRDRTKYFHLEELKKEAFFQIEKNMEQFAILNDHVRNPLQAIIGLADLNGGDMGGKIISQAHLINDIVTRLDAGWIESEKVREMLSKHYGITVKRRPNVDSPIGMLKTDEIF
ncbi:MAG: PAS domain-containing protein [Methanomicrobium sp.]|nr:PAS domain-containing protein [Methanomicrobium sp.]